MKKLLAFPALLAVAACAHPEKNVQPVALQQVSQTSTTNVNGHTTTTKTGSVNGSSAQRQVYNEGFCIGFRTSHKNACVGLTIVWIGGEREMTKNAGQPEIAARSDTSPKAPEVPPVMPKRR